MTKENNQFENIEENNIVPFTKQNPVIPEFASTLSEAKSRIEMLHKYVQEMMVEGIDYGVIPGSQKPSLLKPGAEKLCEIYGFSKIIEVINRVEDWEQGIFHYEVKATLINKRTGLIEAEGIGSCNSREKKYKKLDGYTIANTILKMAKKRALIDAVLSATRSSSIFTQDLDELTDDKSVTNKSLENDLKELYSLVKKRNIPFDDVKKIMKERYGIESSKHLDVEQVKDLIGIINNI